MTLYLYTGLYDHDNNKVVIWLEKTADRIIQHMEKFSIKEQAEQRYIELYKTLDK